MTDHLYLVGDYEAAASIPIGATLARLEAEHNLLPVAFYEVLTTNLYKWMRVYDYLDAQEHAEMWMEDLQRRGIGSIGLSQSGYGDPRLYQEAPEDAQIQEMPGTCCGKSNRTRAWLAN